jgi:hypothetical protein
MADWIPFLQSLLWPLVVIWLVWIFKPALERLFSIVTSRIERGDSFEASASGVKLGSGQPPKVAELVEGKKLVPVDDLPHPIYIIHSKRRDSRLDKEDLEYYRLHIWIDADFPELLQQILSVTYHLHPTFREPVRTAADHDSKFALATVCWGEFNMFAEVMFKDQRPPLRIERYIDL